LRKRRGSGCGLRAFGFDNSESEVEALIYIVIEPP
jgi:hypothetical protein